MLTSSSEGRLLWQREEFIPSFFILLPGAVAPSRRALFFAAEPGAFNPWASAWELPCEMPVLIAG